MATFPPGKPRSGLLRRLLRSRAGNTLVITGVAMVPMAALAGSAVDMSRLYLVKVRLQQACDAGALAGRRFMTGQTFDANASTQANAFFNFNFPDGSFDTTGRSFLPQRTDSNQVEATASVTVPMAVMQMFGKEPVTLNVECEAKYEIANTDVVFVLDVTGSMACGEATSAASCSPAAAALINGRWQNPQATSSRLMALRTAIKGFYGTLDDAISSDARLRFGFVPYASSVNVGGITRAMSTAHFSDFYDYQSRVREQDGTFRESSTTSNWAVVAENLSEFQQISYRQDREEDECESDLDRDPRSSTNLGTTTTTDDDYVETQRTTYRRIVDIEEDRATWGINDTRGDERDCRIERRTGTITEERATTVTRRPNWRWRYQTVRYDTTAFLAGNAVTTRTGNIAGGVAGNTDDQRRERQGTEVISSWSGCIQERRTVAGVSVAVGDTNADDLDIDLIPNSDETRWKPSWPEITFNRQQAGGRSSYIQGPYDGSLRYRQPTGANTKFSCPKAAQRLEEMSSADIDTYVDANDFAPHGGTYHDIGLVWGARLLSPTGIFAADNAVAPNGNPTQRHIIFMTDGAMAPNPDTYGSYGIEEMEGRVGDVTGLEGAGVGAARLTTRHNNRFLSLCEAIKDREITLWVVAYGQDLTDELEECATPGKSFEADDEDELQEQFQLIASQIAELRLEK